MDDVPTSRGGKLFEFSGRGATYRWAPDELDDTLFEGERWGKPAVRKRVAKLRVGQEVTVDGETLRRINPTDEDCPHCGVRYDDFRTGLHYADVYAMLWVADPDPTAWVYKRRGTVLGYWRMLKHQMWEQHVAECSWYAEQEEKEAVGNPLRAGPPPQYVMGGMGTPQIWTYLGTEIVITEDPRATDPHMRYAATWLSRDDSISMRRMGPDPQTVLASARHHIDLERLGQTWQDAAYAIDLVIDLYLANEKGPLERGRIARHMEVVSKKHPTLSVAQKKQDAFYKLPLPDRLRLIDEVIAENVRAGSVDDDRLPNPLIGGQPPQYVMGGVGVPEVWSYRGRQIVVQEQPSSQPSHRWVASWGGGRARAASDKHNVLSAARTLIDLEDLNQDWNDAWAAAGYALSDYLGETTTKTGPVNRGRIARQIELFNKEKGLSPALRHKFQAFYALPLPDRLRLLDELIDFYARLDAIHPSRLRPNPDPVGDKVELALW